MSTFPGFFFFSFFFLSMIKCRQGGAARLKFIMLVGCAVGGVRCQRGSSNKKKQKKTEKKEREEKVRGGRMRCE